MANEISMTVLPTRIDGVSQETAIPEGPFRPEGVLEFQYIPLEMVIVREIGSDLVYSCSYWSVERNWRVFLEKYVYDRLICRFLEQREVVLDYNNPRRPKVFLPRDQKINGFQKIYKEAVDDLRNMNSEELQEHLSNLGYDPILGSV
jgi:hypothetical protein